MAFADGVDGFVFPGPRAAEAGLLKKNGYRGAVLIEPEVYADVAPPHPRLFGGPIEHWLDVQLSNRADAVLSPSRPVAVGDEKGLEETLSLGQAFIEASREAGHSGPAYAVLPIDHSWLTRNRPSLVQHLSAAATPVALVLAHASDPLRTRAAVEGLLEVLGACPDTALLRSDHGAIGAVAAGASFGAIGTGTMTRHFAPQAAFGVKDFSDRSPSVFSRALMRFMRGSRYETLSDLGAEFRCEESACDGLPLSRFGDPRLRFEALRHSVHDWAAVAAEVMVAPASSRLQSWVSLCKDGVEGHHELRRRGVKLDPSDQLTAWASL
jgi:hypothetical protein